METVFWMAFGFIGYVYAGYPLVLLLWRRLARRPVMKGAFEPSVSVVVAAHNEGETIVEKMRNCLALDYPDDKVQIIVSLDGPTDGTDRRLRAAGLSRVEVVHFPTRRGKPAALNAAMRKARGELVLFTDARQRLDKTALRELAASFHDPSVGAVSGELVLANEEEGKSDGVGLYWRYEKLLRAMESDVHSMLGATGAIYAIRRELFRPIPEDMILDDVFVPMSAVLSGKRVVFERRARAYERGLPGLGHEYRRKVRTLAGNYQLVAWMPELLNPRRNSVFVQFVSHKLGRLLVPFFLAALFFSNLFLLEGLYAAFFVLQAGLYSMAAVGPLFQPAGAAGCREAGRLRRLVLVSYTFVLLNGAAVAALGHFLAGRRDIYRRLWTERPVSPVRWGHR